MIRNPNTRILGGAFALFWGMAAAPRVAAERVCYTTTNGLVSCGYAYSYGARIAIGIGASIFLAILFSLALLLCLRSSYRLEHDEERAVTIYHIDPSQIHGPPPAPPEMTSAHLRGAPSFPEPIQVRSGHPPATEQRYVRYSGLRPPQTAPVQYSNGSYPFPGYSSQISSIPQPHTAFVGGNLRPMYAGQPFEKENKKDDKKDDSTTPEVTKP